MLPVYGGPGHRPLEEDQVAGYALSILPEFAELLGISDERDRQLKRRHQAWRDGWLAGHEAGYLQCASDVKAAEHGTYDHLAKAGEAERTRWWLRGQPGTRGRFGQPHPDDFAGRGDVA